ncbi:stage II sporulation protein D [Paenibacillus sp. GCM10028914]|uniref:stage II sporulation protein D n=1 Tax=Paenibacillus sp. GCM10028914 TaxID=3273416 RepID=UPI003618F173
MKDSKVRIQIPITPEKKNTTVDQAKDHKEEWMETEGTAARVLEWKFPQDEKIARRSGTNINKKRHDSIAELEQATKEIEEATFAAQEAPIELDEVTHSFTAAGSIEDPSSAEPGPRSALPGQTPREHRAFRARPSRFGRRGSAARRPAAPGRRVRLHPAAWAAAGLLALALALPLLVVAPGDHKAAPPAPGPAPAPSAAVQPAEEPTVSVYLTKTDTVETLPLETYIVGVVAAEMPAEFQLEALKAQAIAARTYIVQRLKSGDKSGVPEDKGDVTDTINHQAYISKEKLEKEWAAAGEQDKLAKLRQAVKETKGIVMTYKGQPITASFFSTSNGYTENSEDYWKNEIPYLRSVESPWDTEISPKYKTSVTMSRAEIVKRLGLSDTAIPVSASSGNSFMKVISYTKGNRIQEVRVGGKKFTGREIREKLDLRSSQFSWTMKDGEVVITTYGNGHGVGMSQYGAEGMAREGYKAKEILRHYYTGISFQETSKLLSSKK